LGRGEIGEKKGDGRDGLRKKGTLRLRLGELGEG
jgi:hypothetical protein